MPVDATSIPCQVGIPMFGELNGCQVAMHAISSNGCYRGRAAFLEWGNTPAN
jgi:hypothetical protein